jgi:N-acetylmuramoyl-L-alanine amidase
MANTLFKGISAYFHAEPPVGTVIAMKKHGLEKKSEKYVIRSGDTLSGIAQQHRVSIAALRRENGLRNDRIRRGQVLQIPKT